MYKLSIIFTRVERVRWKEASFTLSKMLVCSYCTVGLSKATVPVHETSLGMQSTLFFIVHVHFWGGGREYVKIVLSVRL